jgi:hypothetical protein
MTDAPEEFTTQCGWCRRTVVSFVAPPAMIEVVADPGMRHDKSVWRLCLECYTELIKLIASRAANDRPGSPAATAL